MLNRIKRVRIATFSMILVTFIWGTGFPAVKLLMRDHEIEVLFIIGTRFIIGGLILAMIFYRQVMRSTKRELKYSLLLGFILASAFTLQTYGVKYTSVINNAFLSSLVVVITPLFMIMFTHTKLSRKVGLTAILAVIGTVVLSQGSAAEEHSLLGDILSLACAVFYSLHFIVSARFARKRKLELISVSVGQLLVAGTLSMLMAYTVYPMEDINNYIDTFKDIKAMGIILYLAALSTAFCFTVQLFAQKVLPPHRVGIITSFEAVFGAIFGVTLLGEKLNWHIVVGVLLIFLAVVISETNFKFLKKYKKKRKA